VRFGLEKPFWERNKEEREKERAERSAKIAKDQAETEETLQQSQDLLKRMQAQAAAGQAPSEADLEALKKIGKSRENSTVAADPPADAPSTNSAPATEGSASSAGASAGGGAAASSNLQREYARLAQLLNSDDTFGKREACESLLKVRPSDVASADTRKLIARGYLAIAKDSDHFEKQKAIRGLVIWGGKFSVPILIELLDKDRHGQSEELYDGLAQLKDPKGAEALARRLGDFFAHDNAVNALRKMGSAAEDALIKVAPSNDPKVSLAALQLLGEVGSEKSNSVLQRATSARNAEIKAAAREAIARIRTRKNRGETVDKSNVDPNSPFAEGSGPPVDITARNSRDYADRAAMDRDNSFGGGKSKAGGAAAEVEEVANLDEGDWSRVNALLPGDPEGSGVPADPATNDTPTGWKPQPVRLGNTKSVHERAVAMSVSGGMNPIAIVAYHDPFNDSVGRLETVNLKQRKSIGSTTIVGGVKQCYLSPSGARALLVGEEGFHSKKARLDVWSIGAGKPVEEVTWWPFATSKGHWGPNDINWADWVDDDQLLIVNGEGTTVLWRIEGKKAIAVYQIDADGRCTPAISPGRKHMALSTPRGVEIFRAHDGALLARMENVRPGAGQVAFNQDGTKLACVSGKSIYIWDATTGNLERDFDCTNLHAGELHWLDNDHLLVGNTDIIDIPRRMLLWRYEATHLPAQTSGAWRWLMMQSNNILGLVPSQMLQPEVLEAAKGLDPDAILALKPGAKVSLDLQLGGEDQQKAEAALRRALEQSGMEVVSDSPIKIAARIVTGESETKEYGTGFFHRQNVEQVTVTSKRYEVEVMVDGQSAWKQISTIQAGAPSAIWLQNGESAQQAIDRQNAANSANFSFSATMPRYIVHPKYAGPMGTSKISLSGSTK
jgi:WD40 repeat protein